MTRDAKLYILADKDWKPLAEILEQKNNYKEKLDTSIYQLMTSTSIGQHYAILTLSEESDKIVEEYGATIADDKNLLRISLHNYNGEILFGDKTNVVFLNKLA